MRQFLLLPAVMLALVARNKPGDVYTSSSLNARVQQFSTSACAGGTVTRYDFSRVHVYVFDYGCHYPDEGTDVTDEWGNSICALGTIAGNVDCMGQRFSTSARNPVIIYRK